MPHTISQAEVERSADLGRLALSSEELADATKKLDDILGYFAAIQKIDTAHVAMADDVSGLTNVARDDLAQPEVLCTTPTLLARAPAVQANQLKVRAVFE